MTWSRPIAGLLVAALLAVSPPALSPLALSILGLSTGAAQAAPPEKIRVALGSGALFFTLHYVAEAGGFYKAQGLDPDTIDLSSGPRQTAAVMGGSVDVALLGLQLVIQAVMRGGDIVAISTGYDVMPISLVLGTETIARTGITSDMPIDERVKRLAGLRLAITVPGSGTDDMARALLKHRGMDPDKAVTLQPLVSADAMLAALQQGATDGFFYTSPVPEIAAQRHIGHIIIEPLDGDVPETRGVPYIILSTSRDTLARKRPMLLRVVRAYRQVMAFVRTHPDEARAMTRRYFPDLDAALFDAAFTKYMKGLPESPLITPQQVGNTVTWMNLSKKTPVTAKYEEVVEPSLAEEVLKEKTAN